MKQCFYVGDDEVVSENGDINDNGGFCWIIKLF